jgi:hypothetical protein
MLLVGAMLLYTNTPYICHLAISCYYSGVLGRGKAGFVNRAAKDAPSG